MWSNKQKDIQSGRSTFQRKWLGQRLKKDLTCGFNFKLDKIITLYTPRASERQRSTSVRAWGAIVLMLAINLISMSSAEALNKKESLLQWKMYAYKKIGNWAEFSCLNYLYVKESNWNPKARNGSHYGIPQGRSLYLATASPLRQIDWGLRYIDHRYSGDACKAMMHFDELGWH